MKISILTATYNREDCLKNLYKSIIENIASSNLDIEWIVIDDGSTDNTKNEIESYIKDNKIVIKYIYQNHLGKMSAINNGTNLITGDLVVDCDSDDYFSSNAFEIIKKNANLLLNNENFYAMCFLKSDTNGNISGNKFRKDGLVSTMFDLYFKDDIKGEKILVFNTKIRKMFKHEIEKKENFITEARMYYKMDKIYKILCINEILEIGDYRKDGYTKNIKKVFYENPIGYYMYFKEIINEHKLTGVSIKKKLYIFKNFIFFLTLNFIKKLGFEKNTTKKST